MSNVQEVRDRIIQLAREIEDHSKQNIPPKTFFQEFLKRVVAAVGARAGAVWLRNGANRLELFSELGLASTTFNENPGAMASNQKLLIEVISNGQACTYHPSETSEELPTDDMLVLAALQQNKEVVGVVEIFQRRDTPPQARPGFLQFVEQMTGYACRFLDRQAAPKVDSQISVPKVAEEFEQFILQLHRSLDVREVAVTTANDGRLLVGCDRLSVAVLDGRKTVIRAVSGQESVNHRANLIRRMTTLADKVISSGEQMLYTGKVDHLAPQVEKALGDYVQESGSRMVIVIPFFEPDPIVEKQDERARPKEKVRKPIGGLIIEQMAESQPKTGVVEKSELIADHVASAVFNAKSYHRIFLMPLWRGIGRCLRFLEGRNGLKALLILLALIGAGTALVLIPYDYRVEGQGRLVPIVQKDVFAPWDGEVVEILVQSGERVKAGQTLLKIRNPDMNQQLTAALGELDSKRALRASLSAEHSRIPGGSDNEARKTEIEGRYWQTAAEIESLEQQIKILTERVAQLEVKSPIDGLVATFQIEQLLLNRPVKRGEVLLEVKDDSSGWQLELEVEEKRMGHFVDAQKAAKKPNLPVEYVLVTDSEKKFQGEVIKVDTRTNSSQESGSVVVVHSSLNVEDLPRDPRIGAEVRAKINCGKKSLGYVLFGDVYEFIQKYLWL